METVLQVRAYESETDFPMISQWWDDHGHGTEEEKAITLAILPPLGIVVHEQFGDDILALWLHLSLSCGACFLEPCISRPGLKISQTTEAVLFGIEALKKIASDQDYGVMILRAYPAMAKVAKRAGFVTDGRPLIGMVATTREGALCQ